MKNKKKKLTVIFSVISILIIIFISSFLIYASDYYHADNTVEKVLHGNEYVKVSIKDDEVVFVPTKSKSEKGFIFYPGGKVEYTAYANLMMDIASHGYTCIIPKMPLNLAVLKSDAAEDVIENHPEIKDWYIGGHSLGGSMAAVYASENEDEIKGLALLAAYSTEDISKSDLKVISIYGSNDNVLNKEKYKDNISNLPADFTEVYIDGGNHSGFGSYGKQDGDGKPLITGYDQQRIASQAIAECFK